MKIKRFDNKIWLASPTMHGDELKYMKEAYDTNWMSTLGENINEIEASVPQRVGVESAVALSSGTAALHLAIKLAGVKPGDIVFCSDMTFAATANPIVYEGGVPVFIDSDRETWNMDPLALQKAFERYPDCRVVMVANLYGTPSRFDELLAICEQHGAILIEDAAESLGATYKGQASGSFGKYNVISFNGNKIITGTSGGMLLTDDSDAAAKARKWSTQSREVAPWYQHEEIGYNYRMSNVIAGVVRGQLPYLDEHIAAKKRIYQRYAEAFSDIPVEMNPYIEGEMQPNFWLSCITVNEDAMCRQWRTDTESGFESESGKSCPTEILGVLAEYNVEGRPIWKPMHMQPIYSNNEFVTATDGKAVNEDIFNRGLCLPSDISMTDEQQDIIIEIVKRCFV